MDFHQPTTAQTYTEANSPATGQVGGTPIDVDGDSVTDAYLSEPFDLDANGVADTVLADVDFDGEADGALLDIDEDGEIESVATVEDIDGDGTDDSVAVDVGMDGAAEVIVSDTAGDASPDLVIADTDLDGELDSAVVDTDNDGIFDELITADGSSPATGMDEECNSEGTSGLDDDSILAYGPDDAFEDPTAAWLADDTTAANDLDQCSVECGTDADEVWDDSSMWDSSTTDEFIDV